MSGTDDWDGASPWLFLLGLLIFIGSVLLFIVDFLRGVDVLRSIAANGVGTALLIAWAAHDTLRNPDSEVGTAGGAAGTALLLYGLYLLGSGLVISVTGLFHDHGTLGFIYLGLAIMTVVLGYAIFPKGAVLSEEADAEDDPAEPPAES